MAEIDPTSVNLQEYSTPKLIYFDDATDAAREALDKFSVEAEADPDTQIDALTFYAAHPEAAIAIVALHKHRPNIVQALDTVGTIYENQYDIQADFDSATEEKLAADQKHRHYRDKMLRGRGKEVQAEAKHRMRINRLKFFINAHVIDETNPNSVPPAA